MDQIVASTVLVSVALAMAFLGIQAVLLSCMALAALKGHTVWATLGICKALEVHMALAALGSHW